MFHSAFRFTLVIADPGGSLVHREEVRDFMPCYEDLLFAGVMAGEVPNDSTLPPASLEPVFADGSRHRVAALTATLLSRRKTYGLSLLAEPVRAALIERKVRGDGAGEEARVIWWLEAEEADGGKRPGRPQPTLRRQPYPILHSSLAAFGVEGEREEKGPISVFIRGEILAALRDEATRNLEVERADILIGHLVQERAGHAAVVVTGRIPALAEAAARTHFQFSPLTFVAARQDVARRSDGATIVGWAHNHPPPCGGACLQVVPPCATGMLFFSSPHDHAVHRALFSARYMVALVAGKEAGRRADDPGVRAFGWQDGAIVERAFGVF